MIHTSPTEASPFEILEVLEEAGAALSRVAFAHLGRTVYDDDNLLRLAEKGCYLEYDLFGTECSHYQVSVVLQIMWHRAGSRDLFMP